MSGASAARSQGKTNSNDVEAHPDEVARKQAMDVLASANANELADAWESWTDRPDVAPLRGPETGLVMIRGRMGGGGAPFNFGEATVTRATVSLSNGQVGHAYALALTRTRCATQPYLMRSGRMKGHGARWKNTWLRPFARDWMHRTKQCREETAATRVDFFTMVRGED